jgi:hypothetical protein
MMQLILNGVPFAISSMTISGRLYADVAPPEMAWSVDAQGDRVQLAEDVFSKPHLYDEALQFAPKSWHDLENKTVSFDAGADQSDDGDGPALYLVSHLTLQTSKLVLGKRTGAAFELDWSGVADANIEPFGTGMPFVLKGLATFTGVEVRFVASHGLLIEQFEVRARELLQTQEFSSIDLKFANFKRFRDDPNDPDHNLIRVFFEPAPG